MNQANDSTTEGQNTDCGVQFNAVSLSLIKTRDNTYYVTLNNLTKDLNYHCIEGDLARWQLLLQSRFTHAWTLTCQIIRYT